MPLHLDNDDVARLVTPAGLADALERAYRAYAAGEGVSPPRQDLQAAPAGAATYQLGVAAGLSGRYGCLRIKSDLTYLVDGAQGRRKEKYCVEPGLYCGLILLFSVDDGRPLAIVKDGCLQQMRVAADSAIGARLMARPAARTLGILGAGGMARAHLHAVGAATGVSRVCIYSPTEANRDALAGLAESLGYASRACASAEEVAAEADILCACTNSPGPVVLGRDLRPGTHVTAIGGTLDEEASARVDRWLRLGLATQAPEWGGAQVDEECLSFSASGSSAPSGGTRRFASIPLARRILLSELLAAPGHGRQSGAEITFSERGNIHGLQFAAAAGHLYERAVAAGAGRELPLDDLVQTVRN